jgi:hypothetical protein
MERERIKNFLKAKKPETLQVLMLENNLQKDFFFNYSIVYADGFWFAWYDHDASEFIKQKYQEIKK